MTVIKTIYLDRYMVNMTVAELIDQLSILPSTAAIGVRLDTDYYGDVDGIRLEVED